MKRLADGPGTRLRTKKAKTGANESSQDILRQIAETKHIGVHQRLRLYNADKPVCHCCRSNSRENPNCFCGFAPPPNGVRKQGLWQKTPDVVLELGPNPEESMRSVMDRPIGLVNLGATCYVNSVLQCLYMNTAFRAGLFAVETDILMQNKVLYQLGRLFAELQLGLKNAGDPREFARTLHLDNGVQQDGQEFMKLLLTLLETMLAKSKRESVRGLVQGLFRGTFSYATRCWECGFESGSSEQLVDFYELEVNVKGFRGLEESLDDYLSEEKLEGENQYLCEYCGRRVDATRCVKLRSFPPIVNFQLKRFVFNPKTAMKKKVTSRFNFPKTIDLAPRLTKHGMHTIQDESAGLVPRCASDPEEGRYVYDLMAILIHKGNMASSGHYIAHIKDDVTNEWWQFDDETVTCLGCHPLGEAMSTQGEINPCRASSSPEIVIMDDDGDRLEGTGNTMTVGGPAGTVDGKIEGGTGLGSSGAEAAVVHDPNMLTSADAYMLMYRHRVNPQNEEEKADGIAPEADGLVQGGGVEIKEGANSCPKDTGDLLNGASRGDFAESSQSRGSGDGGSVASTLECKIISPQPEFCHEIQACNQALQESCLEYKERLEQESLRIKARREEVRTILSEIAVNALEEPFFWINSDWLRTWADSARQIPPIDNNVLKCEHGKVPPSKVTSMKRISEKAWTKLCGLYGGGPVLTGDDCCEACIFEEAKAAISADSFRDERAAVREMVESMMNNPETWRGPCFYVSKQWLNHWLRRKQVDVPSDADSQPLKNLVCPHDGLYPEQAPYAKRQLVPQAVWEYFARVAAQVEGVDVDSYRSFSEHTEDCSICEVDMSKEALKQEDLRASKLEERQVLEAVYSGRPVPIHSDGVYYLVPTDWLQRWRAFVSASGKNVMTVEGPDGLEAGLSSLICEKHWRLLHPPPELTIRKDEAVQRSMNEEAFTVVSERDWFLLRDRWAKHQDGGLLEIQARVQWVQVEECDVSQGGSWNAKASTAFPKRGRQRKNRVEEEKEKERKDKDRDEQQKEEEKEDKEMENGKSGNADAEEPRIVTSKVMWPQLITEPPLCAECIADRQSTELISKLSYTNGEITVELLRGTEPPPSMLCPAAMGTVSGQEGERRSKRVRKATAMTGGRAVLKVSGTMTVFELKMLVWESLGVTRENQRLGFGNRELNDNRATMADVNVLPGARLWVFDTGQHQDRDIAEDLVTEVIRVGEPEEGFKGTGLLGHGKRDMQPSLNGACDRFRPATELDRQDHREGSGREREFVCEGDVGSVHTSYRNGSSIMREFTEADRSEGMAGDYGMSALQIETRSQEEHVSRGDGREPLIRHHAEPGGMSKNRGENGSDGHADGQRGLRRGQERYPDDRGCGGEQAFTCGLYGQLAVGGQVSESSVVGVGVSASATGSLAGDVRCRTDRADSSDVVILEAQRSWGR
ncbi:hypothetical protein CBR_g19585 [Chara braunii]|uniref:ubiquitinyl hydrolase 1 n=1 Tax=Chara braunii TaxID=69332 RepID=A0A388KYL8_CHABU|nr:hypothetical protein CBR_g19585 [Chara braunii]|eukprot:GBG75072.1 hypothetical protein CBR_g19585 [Chara braunii]